MTVMSCVSIWSSSDQKSFTYIHAVGVLCLLLIILSHSVFSYSQTDCFSLDMNLNHTVIGNCACQRIITLSQSRGVDTIQVNFSISDNTNNSLTSDGCNSSRLLFIDSLLHISANVPVSFKKLKTLDLSRNFLEHIPDCLPEKLIRLNLSGNRIVDIEARSLLFIDALDALNVDDNLITSISNRTNTGGKFWQNMHLSSLRKLSLQRNKIHSVDARAFKHLKKLSMLSLSGNRISSLHLEAFDGLDLLSHLDLSDNILFHIDDYTFYQLPSLTYLSLRCNRLMSLPRGLPMLEWLDISFNSLQNISEEFKPEILAIEFTNFAHNPLFCDCNLLWLKEAYDRREYVIQYLNTDPLNVIPTCHFPDHLLNESWDVLSDDMFTCESAPDMSLKLSPQLKPEQKDIVKEFVVKGEVLNESSVAIVWKFKNAVIPNNGIRISYYIFGHKSSTLRHVNVATTDWQFILGGLSSQSNYMICVNLVGTESDLEAKPETFPVHLDHCLELMTKAHHPPLEMTYFAIYWWYVLTMVTTFFTIVGFITGLAFLCSLLNRRHTLNSKSTYPVDEPLPPQTSQAENFFTGLQNVG